MFGLIPHWATDAYIGRQTYNARTETVAAKPSFRDAWIKAQHCIIPVDAFFEPDWRSGKAIATRISCASGEPLRLGQSLVVVEIAQRRCSQFYDADNQRRRP